MMVTLNLSGCCARVAAQDWRLCQWGSDGYWRSARLLTIPAAPPPTMTTFFLPFLSKPSEDMVRMVRLVRTTVAGLSADDRYMVVDAGRGAGIVFIVVEDEGDGDGDGGGEGEGGDV